MRFRKACAAAGMSFLLVAFLGAVGEACPTCRQGLADGQHANMIRGYFWSIVFMMSMPFLIFASLGSYFYLQVRRARLTRAVALATPGQRSSTTPHTSAGQQRTADVFEASSALSEHTTVA